MPSTSPTKAELRKSARQRRAGLRHGGFAEMLAAHADALAIAPGVIVAGYHAHQDEADPALLLQRLARMGARIAFPRVTAKDAMLEFHLQPEGETLQPGAYGISEPLQHWPLAVPRILLVPLLAYDDRGHRLGYGGGYYDRTLAALPAARAIGIAYAGQWLAALPHDPHDIALDAVLTENGLHHFTQHR